MDIVTRCDYRGVAQSCLHKVNRPTPVKCVAAKDEDPDSQQDGIFPVMEFDEGHLGIGVDEGLLINSATPLRMPTY